ncbi:MAG: D-alanine--D-alanine ligase [Rhodothermales bacterium]
MIIGLVYDIFEAYPWRPGDPPDADAEYEPEVTVVALEEAILRLGHTPQRIGTAYDLLQQLNTLDADAVVNIAEAAHTRNREGYVPTLLEMQGVPFLGSDALTLSLSLDKAWTKDLAQAAGIATPPYACYTSPDDVPASPLPAAFPLFVKPRYEGSSKGITPASRVMTLEALRDQVAFVTETYQQDALVEAFISGGGEFTIGIIGHDPPEALPVLQRAVEPRSRIGLHALEHRGLDAPDYDYMLEGQIDDMLETRLQQDALAIFEKLECRDFARLDFRVDAEGTPWFLEINPLPTFDPEGTFAITAELMGVPYPDFLADVLHRGLVRLGLSS